VLVRIPASWPLIGGPVTLNAVLYGVVSGVAILTLVLIGTTVAGGLVWADLMRSLPPRVAPLAVAGSVAWSFLPGASRAFADIRESQAARGHRVRGLRDLPPLVVPLLGGGLEGALATSEALEARGFGNAGETPARTGAAGRWMLVGALGGAMLLAYAFAVGRMHMALGGLLIAAALGFGTVMIDRGHQRRTTRYRVSRWHGSDRAVAAVSLLALAVFLWRQAVIPAAATFNPYPTLGWPTVDLLMLVALAGLLAPALIVPAGGEGS
jgi:energy-coupling factor transport system permease protein